ncbi:MAG: xanthine dehydrogenase [Methylocystis sp.]|uniref:xanthine dehydrogenase n=1 Tax=Methylocystis sp. TaxID=1911079 RepID=UPI003D0F4E1A
MADKRAHNFLTSGADLFAIVLGTNEIASAIAVRLCWERYRVVMSYDPFPPVIRRGMAFHDALYDDRADVDGIVARRAETAMEIVDALSAPGSVVVTHRQLTDIITLKSPTVIVDARMQKSRTTPDLRRLARLTIGVGPEFAVHRNCDVAIETHPASTGALVENGQTRPGDGVPRTLGGAGRERFVYSTCDGVWRTPLDVGALVFRGYVLGYQDRVAVCAPMDGYLRGIARDGAYAPAGVKLVEIDPRGRAACWTGSDGRGDRIAEAVVAAIVKTPSRSRVLKRELSKFH